jgi:hypothetical protein
MQWGDGECECDIGKKQRELLKRIQTEFPNEWFMAKKVRTTHKELATLVDAGYLKRSKPLSGCDTLTYRLLTS